MAAANQGPPTSNDTPTSKGERFEVLMVRDIFTSLEDWRKAHKMTRSRAISTAVLKLIGQPVPLANRVIAGALCPKCGTTWPFAEGIRITEHNGLAGRPCLGRPVVVLE